jgi:hypothetical protein
MGVGWLAEPPSPGNVCTTWSALISQPFRRDTEKQALIRFPVSHGVPGISAGFFGFLPFAGAFFHRALRIGWRREPPDSQSPCAAPRGPPLPPYTPLKSDAP